MGLGGVWTSRGIWEMLGVWGWKVLIIGLASSVFIVFWRFCYKESNKYDWSLFGLISICLKFDSDLDLNKEFSKFVSNSKY